jgi:prevent-host-death family protein
MNQMTITEARELFTRLPSKLARSSTSLAITRRGKPVLALLSYDHYEAIAETLEILADEDLMNELRQGIRDQKRGRLKNSKKLARELGL